MQITEYNGNRTTALKKPDISFLNVLFCLFVLTIHLLSSTAARNAFAFFIQRILFCSIFGFIFLSGEKSLISNKRNNVISYYFSRFLKIAVPYLIAATMYYIISNSDSPINGFGEILYEIMTGKIAVHFYFVIVIFQFYILLPAISWIIDSFNKNIVVISAVLINILTVILFYKSSFYNIMFTRYLVCYILGCYAGRYYDEFAAAIKRFQAHILIIYVVSLCFEITAAFMLRQDKISLLIQQIITIVYMPVAIMFWYSISLFITQKTSIVKNSFVQAIDKCSYQIYLWHILIMTFADRLLGIFNVSSGVQYLLLRILLTLFGICGLIFLIRIINKMKSTVLGKSNL